MKKTFAIFFFEEGSHFNLFLTPEERRNYVKVDGFSTLEEAEAALMSMSEVYDFEATFKAGKYVIMPVYTLKEVY